MNRPFLLVGIAAIVTSCFLPNAEPLKITVFLIACMLLTVVLTVRNRDKIYKGVFIALIFVVLIFRFVTFIISVKDVNAQLSGVTAQIDGRVVGVQRDEQNFSSYTVKVERSSHKAADGITVKAHLFHTADVLSGDRITATVTFEEPVLRYRMYDYSNGIYHFCEIESVQVLEKGTLTIWRIAHDLRREIKKAVSESGSGEPTAVLNALIIGDTSGISHMFSDNVKAAGVSHMLVVSGMHLGIICGVLMNAVRKTTGRIGSAVIGIFSVGFLALVCLFHVSVLRASIAYFVMLLGRIIMKNSDALNSLGFGVFAAVLIYPYIFFNVAFLLSVTATFAVIYPAALLMKMVSFEKWGIVGKICDYIWQITAVSACAMLCTLPVVSFYFGYVPLAAPLTNLAVTFAVNFALILGVAATAVYFVPLVGKFVCIPLYFAARVFTVYFIAVVNFIGQRDFGVINIAEDKNIYCFLVVVAFILLVRLIYMISLRKKERVLDAEREDP